MNLVICSEIIEMRAFLAGLWTMWIFVSNAQPTYTSADAPVVGTAFQLLSGTWAQQSGIGANAIWDYSGTGGSTAFDILFEAASTNPDASTFPEATLCMRSGSTRTYMSVGPDGLYEHGSTYFFTTTRTEEPVRQIPYPLTMGYSWEEEFEGTSGTALFSGSNSGEVVGSGTLRLPWGDIENVLRVKMVASQDYYGSVTEWRTDSVDVYFKSGFPWYLARGHKRRSLVNGAPQPTQYSLWYATQASVVAVEELSAGNLGMDLFPNPTSGSVTVNATLARNGARLEVFDVSGRSIALSPSIGNGPGIFQWVLNTDAWPAGMYSVNITDASGAFGRRKLIVQ